MNDQAIAIRKIFSDGWKQAREKYSFENVHSQEKIGASFVSEIDIFLETYFKERLKKQFPNHLIWAEESGREVGDQIKNIIHLDPLDGTHNFISNSSPFGSMIAIQHGESIIFTGIYDPLRDMFIWSEKNNGAYLENKLFSYNPDLKADKATLMMDGKVNSVFFSTVEKLLQKNKVFRSIRKYGCMLPAVTYASSGWLHTYCIFDSNPYDIYPVIGILQEAGFIILTLKGETWNTTLENSFIATVPEFADQLKEILNTHYE